MGILPFIALIAGFAIVQTQAYSYTTHYSDDFCLRANDTVTFQLSATNSYSTTSMILKTTSLLTYKDNSNCTITIEAPSINGVIVYIRDINLNGFSNCPDYLKFEGNSNYFNKEVKICEKDKAFYIKQAYYFDRKATLLFHAEKSDYFTRFGKSGFEILVTSYTKAPCTASEFRCSNRKCIDLRLRCDGYDNCGDYSDEWFSECHTSTITTGYSSSTNVIPIIVTCVCVGIAIALLAAFISYCRKRNATMVGSVVGIAGATTTRNRQMHPYEPDRPPAYNVAVASTIAYPTVQQPVTTMPPYPAVQQPAYPTVHQPVTATAPYPASNQPNTTGYPTGIHNPAYSMQSDPVTQMHPSSQQPPKY